MSVIARSYLFMLSAYHLCTGCLSYFSPTTAMKFYRRFYDCNPVEQRHLRIILHPWGALAIFAGLTGMTAVKEPSQHPAVLASLALLLLLRIGYRVGLRAELREISGIAPHRNWISIGFLIVGAAILLWAAATGWGWL